MSEYLHRPTGSINPNERSDRSFVAGQSLNQDFTLQIQLSTAGPSVISGTKLSEGLNHTETVLVVEDNQPLRKLVSMGLRSQGYRILSAADGLKALQLAEHRRGQIDALVTDVIMPHAYGPEVASRLSAICPRLAVMYMSGCVYDGFNLNELLAPGRVFLAKPFTLDQLRRKLREALDNRDVRSTVA